MSQISKDDILSLTDPLPAPPVLDPHRPLFESYIRSSHAICTILLSLLSDRLPLASSKQPEGGFSALHRLDAISGDQVRFVHAPPQTKSHLDPGVALGAHTDFGSVTILFNRLGGLQVQLPSNISPDQPTSSTPSMSETETKLCQDNWAYVRPLPGHAIVNLGDALVKFSGTRVRSNIHRVVPAPGEQGKLTRWSLVYFCRPEDDVVLEDLTREGKAEGEAEAEEKVTAKEWILRRALGRRKADGWKESGGTEGVEVKARDGGMRA
jgi:isopenicillin N synthase-like dioxygenase